MNSLTGYQCWNPALISKVINREAVEIDTAYFLATHAPMLEIVYERSPYQMSDSSENGLFSELLRRANNDQHTFIVLKGIPGTGKSHLIRWLYERFLAHQREQQNDSEVALLIRRANSSLANTLLQIIESGLFDSAQFADQVERLKSASSNLTEQALGNRILNGLQEATRAVKDEEYLPPSLPSRRIMAFSPNFLLDPGVRQFLQRPDKAIDRIAAFLSGVGRASTHGEEMPGFEADDFLFPAAEAQRVVSNPEAKKLVTALLAADEIRNDVAAYFNSLLNYAVGWLTAITIDELKRMFGELRRYLRRQNKSLALFIEDITAFTGLDAALIDVLAMQHGVGDHNLCRLISLVGVTDSYYHDRFPDNMRERVTFQLALNAPSDDEALLLNTSRQVAGMAARYLNAMRLPEQDIKRWHDRGADPLSIPNYCVDYCELRSICHNAFGAVSTDITENEQRLVGLYPFNENALWTMYQQIDPRKTTRTPRSLLNSILSYVLQSHGHKISERQFPPPPAELGTDFSSPIMRKPQQLRVISDQAGSPARARRLESLVLFWGNRTLDATEYQGVSYVSQLPKAVFDTFDLPFILEGGVEIVKEPPAPAQPIVGTSAKQSATADESPENPYTADIAQWARREGRLENYEVLARHIVKLATNAIDWDMHGVSRSLVDERMRQARFVIEDQAGRSISRYTYVLRNTPEFEQVLYAVADIEMGLLSPGKLGSHVATLSTWISRHELEIIRFVRQPDEAFEREPVPLLQLLTLDVLLLAVLDGSVRPSETSPKDVFKRLVRTASDKEFNRDYRAFRNAHERADDRSKPWIDLIRRVAGVGDDVRMEFLIVLNCPQGASREVRYIDAAPAIKALETFLRDWNFQGYGLPKSGSPKTVWEKASRVFNEIRLALPDVIEVERTEMANLRDELLEIFGQEPLNASWKAFEDFMQYTQSEAKVRLSPIPEHLTKRKLNIRLNELEKAAVLSSKKELAFWLSSGLGIKREAQEYLSYFSKLLQNLESLETRVDKDLEAPDMSDLYRSVSVVRDLFIEVENWLMALNGDQSFESAP